MSISHRYHLEEVAFVWELTKETIHLPLGCLQGGSAFDAISSPRLRAIPAAEPCEDRMAGTSDLR